MFSPLAFTFEHSTYVAVQLSHENAEEVADWVSTYDPDVCSSDVPQGDGFTEPCLNWSTETTQEYAVIGDWIVRNPDGTFGALDADVMLSTFGPGE